MIRECAVSRESRRALHRMYRAYYLQGSDGQPQPVRRNKLAEWVETSLGYVYAPESVRFAVVSPAAYGDRWIEEEEAAREEMHDLFVRSGTDAAYGLMAEWAHVYPSMLGKVFVSDGAPTLEVVADPADVGVWRENLQSLDAQEALCHWFEVDAAQFERLVRGGIRTPGLANEIIDEGRQGSYRGTQPTMLASAVPKILLAAASPTMIGAVHDLKPEIAQAQVQSDVLELCELWIRDDLAVSLCQECRLRSTDDRHQMGALFDHAFQASGEHEWEWRKVLFLPGSERVLWSALNPLLPQRQPLRQLCLHPVLNYVWGVSPLEKLLAMQAWGEDKIAKHDALLDLQLDPPIAIIGISNVDGERAKLLRKVGGTFTIPPTPGADIKRLAPETPPDAAGMSRLIDEWFDRAGGLPAGAQGTAPEPNIRSDRQMMTGARLSSPRTNRRAMRVEDTLEEVATDLLRLHRRVSRTPLRVPLDEPDPETGQSYRSFYFTQMPGDFAVRVSAHSASPLFQDQAKADARMLREAGVVDDVTFVDIVNPPLADIVRAKARRLQKQKAARAERELKAKEITAEAKAAKAQR